MDARSVADNELRLLRVGAIVLRNRRSLLLTPITLAVVVVAILLLLPRTYTTNLSFISVAKSLPMSSQLAGIAAQFGVAIPGQDAQRSPQFYADLATSPDILLALAQSQFTVSRGRDTLVGDLVRLLDEEDSDREKALYNTMRLLQDDILSVGLNRVTGVVSISATTKSRSLSLAIAERALALINEFDLKSHQAQAAAEKAFIEERLGSVAAELRAAEDELQSFLLRNREFRSDPELVAAHDRIQRNVALRQDVYRSLTESFESARIESARNTPSVLVVEKPKPALRPDRRHLLLKGTVALFFGFVASLIAAAIREMRRERQVAEAEDVEFSREFEATRKDIQQVIRIFARRASSRSPS